MIQLVFETGDPAAARRTNPVEVGYSQHEAPSGRSGVTRSSSSSTAPARWCMRPQAPTRTTSGKRSTSAARPLRAWVATTRRSQTWSCARPCARFRASRPRPSKRSLDRFEGRWGELQTAFYNGPTGPNLKRQWTEPIGWAEEEWRERSYAMPAGGLLGTSATSFFCGAVGSGSDVLRRVLIAGTSAPFWLLNIVSGLVYVLATPLVALTTTYVYFDAVVRERLGIQEGVDELSPEAE